MGVLVINESVQCLFVQEGLSQLTGVGCARENLSLCSVVSKTGASESLVCTVGFGEESRLKNISLTLGCILPFFSTPHPHMLMAHKTMALTVERSCESS